VLFRPKDGLSGTQRLTFVKALEDAFAGIHVIKRARVGKRRKLGRVYDTRNAQDFPFLAILEFESESDLVAYLEHPAHRSLGEQFYVASESALALDFELADADRLQDLLS
jgi:hypothetical protein